MRSLSRRSMLGIATAALSGLCLGCSNNTNDVDVPKGDGAPVAPPKDMKEWYEKNKVPTTKKKKG